MKAKIKELTDNKVVVECPYCEHDNPIKHNKTDEGIYRKYCNQCGNRFNYEIDREDFFRGLEVSR